jgi:hypothetical protein
MIISHTITLGQLTFIVRVAIQILAYGGSSLIPLIILANVPRAGAVDTHDVVNRIIGCQTHMISSLTWMWRRLRGRNPNDPGPSTKLILTVLPFVLFSAFIPLSDIGFLGFYQCSVPGPVLLERPASVSSDEAARALVNFNLVNGTDPSTLKAFRCNSTHVIDISETIKEEACVHWMNSTYGDSHFFDGINSTDTDAILPHRLSTYPSAMNSIYCNSFYLEPSNQRIKKTTIQGGFAIYPRETGLTVVLGVPQVPRNYKVDLKKTMALDVDVGCMTLGVNGVTYTSPAKRSKGGDVFVTEGDWRQYAGPDYLRDVLLNTTDSIRDYYLPMFNTSAFDANGDLQYWHLNSTFVAPMTVVSLAANVVPFFLPVQNSSSDSDWSLPDSYIVGNCTQDLQRHLGIQPRNDGNQRTGEMCGLFRIGGIVASHGMEHVAYRRMVCASAAQLSMVSATAEVDGDDNVSLNVTRLPSDLTYLRAIWRDPADYLNGSMPYERFTLSDNPNGQTVHYIRHEGTTAGISSSLDGPASGGNIFSLIGDSILARDPDYLVGPALDYSSLFVLDQGFNVINMTPVGVTKWMGQFGASFFAGSVTYNGWAALNSSPVTLASTGGDTGSCYRPIFALAFFPLVVSTVAIVIWVAVLWVQSSLAGLQQLQDAYGGMGPYRGAIISGSTDDKVLVWEATPEAHLEIISKDDVSEDGYPGTALRYLHRMSMRDTFSLDGLSEESMMAEIGHGRYEEGERIEPRASIYS